MNEFFRLRLNGILESRVAKKVQNSQGGEEVRQESLGLFSQVSFWSSGRRGSTKFCVDFLGLSYLENNFLLKIYL